MNYLAIIHKESDSQYGVSFPDFIGCITAGETLDQAKELAQEALTFHIDGMIQDGEELPTPSKIEDVPDTGAFGHFFVSF